MKRLTSALLAGAIAIGAALSTPLYAAETVTDKNLEKAILTVKSRITIPDEYSEFNFEKSTSLGQSGYMLRWSREDDKYGEVNITVVDDIIVSYNKYDNKSTYTNERRFAKLTSNQLYEKASALVKKLNPTVFSNIRIDKDSLSANVRSTTATIRLYKIVDGIEVSGDSGSIEVDKDTGDLRSFNLSWLTGVSFSPSSSAISQQKAKESYSSNVGIEPIYSIKSDYTEKKQTASIIYQPKKDSVYIDALTGKVSGFLPNYYGWYGGGYGRYYDGDAVAETAMDNGVAGALTKQELEKVNTEKGLLTAKEALEKVLSEKNYLALGKNGSLRSSSLSNEYFDKTRYTWNISIQYSTDGVKITNTAYATVNAKTGAVISYNNYSSFDSVESFDEKAADKLVNSALTKYLGKDRFAEYKLISAATHTDEVDEIEDPPIKPLARTAIAVAPKYNGRTYLYHRYVNGIKVRDDSINVNVNPEGKIRSLSYNYTNISFPPAAKILTKEQALSKLYSQQDLSLKYYINTGEKNAKTSALLYLMPSFYLNATTGKLCDYYGEEVNNGKFSYSDIEGHSIKNIAEKLAQNGVKLQSINGKLMPDSKIIYSDFVNLLNTCGLYTDFDEEKEKSNLSRKEGVEYFIDALGGKEFAKIKDFYTSPFKDVSNTDEYVGYFALAKGMGIISANKDGKFNPDSSLSRAQALLMVYNYLDSNS